MYIDDSSRNYSKNSLSTDKIKFVKSDFETLKYMESLFVYNIRDVYLNCYAFILAHAKGNLGV